MISFNKGFTARLPSSSAVSGFQWWAPSPVLIGPELGSGLLQAFFDSATTASRLSFALGLIVIVRKRNSMDGTWNLAVCKIAQAGTAHPKVLCSWQGVWMALGFRVWMGTPETVIIKLFPSVSPILWSTRSCPPLPEQTDRCPSNNFLIVELWI